jgi:MFS family permease
MARLLSMRSRPDREMTANIALAWAGSVGALYISLQPMIVGAWVDRAGLSLQAAGMAASANMLGAIIGVLATLLILRRGEIGGFIALAALLAALGDLLTALVPNQAEAIIAVRLLGGIAGGALVAATSASVAALAHPDRAFGLVAFAQILTGALALYFAPALLDNIGLSGLFIALGVLGLSVILVVPWFAQPTPRTSEEENGLKVRIGGASTLILASLAVHYVANNGVWVHLERIGVAARIEQGQIGAALAVGQVFGLFGAALAIVLADRASRLLAICLGVMLTAVSVAVFTQAGDALRLGAGVALFIGSISFTIPFYLGALASRDSSGRLVMVGQLAIMSGLFLGPSLAALIVTLGDLNAMLWACAVGLAVSLILVHAGLRQTFSSQED